MLFIFLESQNLRIALQLSTDQILDADHRGYIVARIRYALDFLEDRGMWSTLNQIFSRAKTVDFRAKSIIQK